jgi:hypothetical protein
MSLRTFVIVLCLGKTISSDTQCGQDYGKYVRHGKAIALQKSLKMPRACPVGDSRWAAAPICQGGLWLKVRNLCWKRGKPVASLRKLKAIHYWDTEILNSKSLATLFAGSGWCRTRTRRSSRCRARRIIIFRSGCQRDAGIDAIWYIAIYFD